MKMNIELIRGGVWAGGIGAVCTLAVTAVLALMGRDVSLSATLWNGVTVAAIYMLIKWKASKKKKILVALALIVANCAFALLVGLLQLARNRSML